ncbi:Protein of unknown function [Bacillus cereus]|nr:Protein of unknown function [Bacillus cereus]
MKIAERTESIHTNILPVTAWLD